MPQNELGSYLRLLRIKNNLTMTQTADKTGITQGYISQIENGIYTPSAKTLAKLARAYSVPEIHLLRKAGVVQLSSTATDFDDASSTAEQIDPLVEVSDPVELMDHLKRGLSNLEYLTDQLRQRGQLASMPSAQDSTDARMSLSAEMTIPLFDGSWQPMTNGFGETAGMQLPAFMCNDDNEAFILLVADDAMAPRILRGDWVVISPSTKPSNGDIVAINDRNQLHLRTYSSANGMISLTPTSPEYASRALVVSEDERDVEIIGRVLRMMNRVM